MRQTILQYIRRYLLPCVLFLLSTTVAHAHESSTAYLNLSPSATEDGTNYRAQYELSLRDLAVLVDIDPNQDKAVSWAEVTAQQNLIQQLISAQVLLKGDDKACHITDFAPLALNTRGGFNYLYTDLLVNAMPASGISTTAKKGGAWTQVSRLGMPLVNEVVIGLKDKDKFNASEPKDDVANFAPYVFYPALPAYIQSLYPSAKAPTNFPRQDLVTAFLTGVPTINKPATVVRADMLRLNTTTPAVAAANQNDLGVISLANNQTDGKPNAAVDVAGFPNGRRPGDDVTDIALRVSMGVLCHVDALPADVTCVPADAVAGKLQFTDRVVKPATEFASAFPYLTTPSPGSR